MRWIHHLPLHLSLLLVALSVGCMGGFGRDTDEQPDDYQDRPPTSCPVDPDCSIGGDCSLYECPEYWECNDDEKRCWNPGPDYPGDGEWECHDVGGTTVCRGRDFPPDGGGSEWNCEREGEFVVCTDDTPNYPPNGGGTAWNCFFEGDLRICDRDDNPGDGGGWDCYDTATGRECRNDEPDYPDDGRWSCWDDNGVTYCRRRGDLPDDGGGGEWNCELQGEFVVCSDDTPDYPPTGGGGEWDCRFGDEFRICTPPDTPPPGDGGSACVPGQQRWCDSLMYCSWGKQDCLPDGSWGACQEADISSATGWLQDRPDTACGCRNFYFNERCCEDQMDRDGDGHADCLIPSGHTPPACMSDGGYCSYCDGAHDHCGDDDDLCLRAPGTTYFFCAGSCSTDSDCSSDATCAFVSTRSGTIRQCVPSSSSRLCGDVTW